MVQGYLNVSVDGHRQMVYAPLGRQDCHWNLREPAMNFVTYYRVSTRQQGENGLGMDAQRSAVEAFLTSQVAPGLTGEYREVETGKRGDRPELQKALAHCRRSKATLVVAKLDRLARNVAFTSTLMDSEVDFVCCDNPTANRLTIHILAAVAEHEAEAISQRTKAALAAAKARGVKLGSHRPGHWEGRKEQRLKGLKKARGRAAEVNRQKAAEAYVDLVPLIQALRAEGHSYQKIANHLNSIGHTTRRGRPWNPAQVRLVLLRLIGNLDTLFRERRR